MKKYVENYKFDRISSKMAKGFGTIPRGKEELYDFMLLPMEGNLLKLHRMVPERNGRRAIEAIHMCLLKVDGYINKIEYDLDRFITNENDAFFKGLLESFDPFTNQVLFDLAKNTYDLYSENDLKMFFKKPVMCLLRIENSIKLWTKELGVDGYFKFIEEQLGHVVNNDEKMNYSMALKDVDDLKRLDIEEPHQ